MSELFAKLGIDWKLLLSQVVNFVLLIFILRYFLYQPILKILKERRERIQEGITRAEEADERLKQSAVHASEKLKDAERQSITMLHEAEGRAKAEEARLLEEARRKEAAVFTNAEKLIEARAEEARRNVEKEAGSFVRKAIAKVAELKPGAIDEALIREAIAKVARSSGS